MVIVITDSDVYSYVGRRYYYSSRCGHSQGGLIALDLASNNNNIAGVILLATTGRPIDKVLQDQIIQQAKDLDLSNKSLNQSLKDHKTLFHYIRNNSNWTSKTVPPKVYALRHLRKWYVELLSKDPLLLITTLKCPVLIIQGDKDIQVSVDDANLLFSAARKNNINSELLILHNYDHLFKRIGKQNGISAYFDRRRRIATTLIKYIQDWINKIQDS